MKTTVYYTYKIDEPLKAYIGMTKKEMNEYIK